MREFIKNLLGTKSRLLLRKIFPSEIQRASDKAALADARHRSKFYGTFIKPGDICFDVGANVGNRVLPMLLLKAKVIAVEPQESCYQNLERKFGKKITIVRKGLGAKEEMKQFYVSQSSVLSSFSEEWIDAVKSSRFGHEVWNEPVTLEVTTADKLIATFGKPAFIKIDVEGYELEVLKGLTCPVKMLSFEYTVPELTQKTIDCIDQVLLHNPEIECNYSAGESMEFAMEQWLNADDMKKLISTDEFINTGFGDIYVRTIV